MSIRLEIETYKALVIAGNRTGLSFTDIGNKSMAKFDRIKTPALCSQIKKYKSDYKKKTDPVPIRFKPELIKGKSQALQRAILNWYLRASNVPPKGAPLVIDPQDIDLMYMVPQAQGEQLANNYINKVR